MNGLDLESRWLALWTALGAAQPPAGEFERLLQRWNEPHRRYHTVEHLRECLDALDHVAPLAASPALIELALWYHDAVHDPLDDHNEANSAYLAERAMAAAGLPRESAGTIRRMILATRHQGRPEDADEALLLDLDLAILGSAEKRYDRYEDDIRAEYHAVPWGQYVAERRKLLKRFHDKPMLYWSDWFRGALDASARANLRRALQRLPSPRLLGP